MRDLTPRQQGNLRPIRDRIGATGLPSASAEIAQDVGFRSVNAAGNPDFPPIMVDPRRQKFVIEGIGGGVLRQGMKL